MNCIEIRADDPPELVGRAMHTLDTYFHWRGRIDIAELSLNGTVLDGDEVICYHDEACECMDCRSENRAMANHYDD